MSTGASGSHRSLGRIVGPYTALRILGQATEFVAWVVLARELAPSAIGELTVAFLACRYGGLLADWGATVRGAREIAGAARPEDIHALIVRRRRLTLALAAAFIAMVVAAGHAALVPVAGTLIGRGMTRDWIAIGRQRGVRAGVPWAVQGCVLLALTTAADDVGSAAAAIGLAYLVGLALSVYLNALPPCVADGTRWRSAHARVDGWGTAILLAEQVTITADVLLLAALRSTTDAGVYALVYRIPSAWTTVLLTAVAGSLGAVAARVSGHPDAIAAVRRRALRLGALGGLAVLVATPVAIGLVAPLFGDDYTGGRPALAVLMIATAIKTFAAPLQPLCLARRPDREFGMLMLGVAGVNVAANLVLIPTVGMTGAASATLTSELVLAAYLLRASLRPSAAADGAAVSESHVAAAGVRPQVDVVILTWNDGDLLQKAVDSVLASTGVDAGVVVVDNGSQPPASVHEDPRVRLIRNDENRGVAGGRNQGVRATVAPFVCLLDSDARLEPDCLAQLVRAVEAGEDVALSAPVFVGQRPEDSGGQAPTLSRKIARITGRTSSYATMTGSNGGAQWDVDFAIGACQLFRRAAYDDVGGIDERYFYGPEDVDFCLRLQARGYRLVQVAAAACHHPPRRSHRKLLTARGAAHAVALCRHLWRHRGGATRPRPA